MDSCDFGDSAWTLVILMILLICCWSCDSGDFGNSAWTLVVLWFCDLAWILWILLSFVIRRGFLCFWWFGVDAGVSNDCRFLRFWWFWWFGVDSRCSVGFCDSAWILCDFGESALAPAILMILLIQCGILWFWWLWWFCVDSSDSVDFCALAWLLVSLVIRRWCWRF